MKLDKPDTIKIHFILGSGRSGTTLLFHIFNNHKNIVSSPELKHLLFFYEKYQNMTEVTTDLIKDVGHFNDIIKQADDMSDYYDFSNTKFTLTLGEKMNYFEFCQRIYFIFLTPKHRPKEITTIIDKNPNYTLHVDKLSNLLPDAKFLCVLRDYRSFVLSNIQSKGYGAKHLPIQYHSLVWMFYNKLVLQIQSSYQKKIEILRYEDLVINPEKKTGDLFRFFDLKYDADCLNFQDSIKQKGKEEQRHERITNKMNALSKPINTERLEAWKDVFTRFEIKVIEFWCASTGEKFGYKKTTHITVLESIAIIIISIPYYIRVWSYFKLKSVRLDFYLNEVRRAKNLRAFQKQNQQTKHN